MDYIIRAPRCSVQPAGAPPVLEDCQAGYYLAAYEWGVINRGRTSQLVVGGDGRAVNCVSDSYAAILTEPPRAPVLQNVVAEYIYILSPNAPNSSEGFLSDYNDFSKDGSGYLARWDNTTTSGTTHYQSLTAWQSTSGQDAHSISADPQLDEDGYPDSDSPCIDRGVAVCPARAGWGGRYDIGCYEYDSRAGGTGVTLAYDDAGNLTDDGDKVYEYDVLGRVTLVKSSLNANVSLAAYRYDGLDRLVMAITYDYRHNGANLYDPLNTTRYFYYDVGPVGAEVWGGMSASKADMEKRVGQAERAVLPQVIEQRDGGGQVTDQFVWGPAYVDELLLHERDADGDGDLDQRLYAVHDRQYSVLRLTDEDGQAVEAYAYSPYGADPLDPREGVAERTDSAAALPIAPGVGAGQFLYTGCRFDAAIGLNHHRARFLAHSWGRWTQREPLGVAYRFQVSAGNGRLGPLVERGPQDQYEGGPNLYQYISSQPARLWDPSGLVGELPWPLPFDPFEPPPPPEPEAWVFGCSYYVACRKIDVSSFGEWLADKCGCKHCEIRIFDIPVSGSEYEWTPTRESDETTRSLQAGKANGKTCRHATCSDIASCLEAARGHEGTLLDNCHDEVRRQLKKCCLSSDWRGLP